MSTMTQETQETTTGVASVIAPIECVRDAVAWASASNTSAFDHLGSHVNVSINGKSAHWVGSDTEATRYETGLVFAATDRYRATWATVATPADTQETVSVTVEHKQLKAAVKALGKTGDVTVTVGVSGVTFTTNDARAVVHAALNGPSTFPKLDQLVGTFAPNGDSFAAYTPALLASIMAAGKTLKLPWVRLLVNAAQKATYITATPGHDEPVLMSGLLMPVRIK